jgi:hypothetical protein
MGVIPKPQLLLPQYKRLVLRQLPQTWSKDEAAKLLKLFFRSLFFVLPKAGFEASQIAWKLARKWSFRI